MRKIQFINEHYYHIYNRGVEKRDIFLDTADYWRFTQDICEFNDSGKEIENRHLSRLTDKFSSGQHLVLTTEPFVDVLCYCLMPNHFHFLLRQRIEGGVSNFMHRLTMGYSKYFNKRYERIGGLFQGTFRANLIKSDQYFLHLSRYIHLNPIKLILPNWEKEGVQDWDRVERFLENYRWSSYPVYLGIKKSSIVSKGLLGDIFKSPGEYRQFVLKWATSDLIVARQLLSGQH